MRFAVGVCDIVEYISRIVTIVCDSDDNPGAADVWPEYVPVPVGCDGGCAIAWAPSETVHTDHSIFSIVSLAKNCTGTIPVIDPVGVTVQGDGLAGT